MLSNLNRGGHHDRITHMGARRARPHAVEFVQKYACDSDHAVRMVVADTVGNVASTRRRTTADRLLSISPTTSPHIVRDVMAGAGL